MPEQIERKFIPLSELKMSDEAPGFIEGYRSVFGEIDEGGDIVIKGAFADSISDYLHSGFTAHSHDWDFDKAVGFPVDAKEDDYGFFVKSQFHSTEDSQVVRTKVRERMGAGKQVGFSYGYKTDSFVYVEQKDFKDELPQYIKPDRLEENLKKAQRFSRIRIIKKNSIMEDSIVTAPMNKLAAATAVKSETKEFDQQIKELLATHGDEKIIERINQELSDPDNCYLKGVSGTEAFESFESAGTALEKFAQKMRSNHEIRVKEGRILSSSNRAKVQACKDSMSALIADLDDLLAISEPKPKEKEINVEALRTQSQRLRNQALGVLAS